MFQTVASQVQTNLVTLLVLGAVLGVSYLTFVLAPKAKQWVNSHMEAKAAAIADAAIDGIAGIAEGVVQHFNQSIVNDAKAAGTFTPDVAKSVLNDAVAAVKSQGASFIQVLTKAGNDAEGLVMTKVLAAVGKYKVGNLAPSSALSTYVDPLQPAVAPAHEVAALIPAAQATA